jgi:iron complex transport system substrate-binding protein
MRRSALLAALLAFLLSAFALPAHANRSAAAITVVDDNHTTLTLTAPPRRIISLAPSVTEILFALGLGDRVVGVSSYSNYPKQATHLPIIIDFEAPSIEKIVALRPDLIVSANIVPTAAVNKLRALHLSVLQTNPLNLAGILSDIQLVGKVAGIPATAASLVAGLQKRINAVEAKVRLAKTHPTVYYELDTTFYTVGHGSFVDSLITMAGGTNVAGTIMTPYPQLSGEKLLVANPQYILLGDASYGVTAAKVAARPGWQAVAAVQQHHVIAFNDDLASRPGPRIVDGLGQMAKILHPELFR